MRKILTLLSFLVIGATALNAQQDAMFTKYMFNSLVYNPAYAGYYDHMYISALYRNQWLGVDGAPTTQTLTLHTPLKNNRVGVGFHVLNDAIGPVEETKAFAAYSYKIPLGGSRLLAIGIQGGISYMRGDRNKLNLEQDSDLAFEDIGTAHFDRSDFALFDFAFGFHDPKLHTGKRHTDCSSAALAVIRV